MFGKVSSRLTTRERVQRTDRRGDERMVSQTSVNDETKHRVKSASVGEKKKRSYSTPRRPMERRRLFSSSARLTLTSSGVFYSSCFCTHAARQTFCIHAIAQANNDFGRQSILYHHHILRVWSYPPHFSFEKNSIIFSKALSSKR